MPTTYQRRLYFENRYFLEGLQLKQRENLGLNNGRWIFRGQKSASWDLSTTFERAKGDCASMANWREEAAILREFMRRVHHYVSESSVPQNVLEWFALMRHYGAPCRLLDCTYSFYVAAYFALRDSDEVKCPAAIWAINMGWLKDCRNTIFDNNEEEFHFKDPKKFYKYFLNHRKPVTFVSDMNPFRMNQRLTAQQGVFLCPGNIGISFMRNLLNMANHVRPGSVNYEHPIVRIPIGSSGSHVKTDAIRELHQMKINSAEIFVRVGWFRRIIKRFVPPSVYLS